MPLLPSRGEETGQIVVCGSGVEIFVPRLPAVHLVWSLPWWGDSVDRKLDRALEVFSARTGANPEGC